MPGVRPALTGLAIVVAEPGPRLTTALTLAAAAAALGREVTMLFDGASVAALRPPADPLIAAAQDLGVRIMACQSGLAAAGLAIGDLVDGVEAGGMVGFLQRAGAAQLALG